MDSSKDRNFDHCNSADKWPQKAQLENMHLGSKVCENTGKESTCSVLQELREDR